MRIGMAAGPGQGVPGAYGGGAGLGEGEGVGAGVGLGDGDAVGLGEAVGVGESVDGAAVSPIVLQAARKAADDRTRKAAA